MCFPLESQFSKGGGAATGQIGCTGMERGVFGESKGVRGHRKGLYKDPNPTYCNCSFLPWNVVNNFVSDLGTNKE